ncbi:MAG: ATP-binding protein [Spirochaetia bacterium]|jgi:SpoVK/Ycf46/Vps4 family AAA+-type ATPase|nr:ATP-binding protein [Spirochaetia bacterium]
MIDEKELIYKYLVDISRFAIAGDIENSRLYIARTSRKLRNIFPNLSKQLATLLSNSKNDSILRHVASTKDVRQNNLNENSLSSFISGPINCTTAERPILQAGLQGIFQRIILERQSIAKLSKSGLKPTSTLFFIGKPGVGKTLSAYWLAKILNLPLYKIDLATVVGSYLGQTGNNLKAALAFAQEQPMVLLLDEIDALAKKRNDDFDIGEIKRIVTVLLQEIDSWPTTSILVAATNNPELVDPALWRRFDEVLEFPLPDKEQTEEAIIRFLGKNYGPFQNYKEIFTILFQKQSFADIENQILKLRRTFIVENFSVEEIMANFIKNNLEKHNRIEMAKVLLRNGKFSQIKISKITGVSRDTIRKYKNQLLLE